MQTLTCILFMQGLSLSRTEAPTNSFAQLDAALIAKLWPAERTMAGVRVCKSLRKLLETEHTSAVLLKLKRSDQEAQGTEKLAMKTIQRFQGGISLHVDCAGCAQQLKIITNVLKCSPSDCQLVKLELGGVLIRGVQDLETVLQRWKHSLTHLRLGACRLDANAAGALVEALGEDNVLQHLRLRWNRIQNAGRVLHALRRCKRLTHLDLRATCLDDTGATSLAETLRSLSSLTHLDLKRNEIGGRGFGSLAMQLAEQPKTLQHVNVSGNIIALGDGDRLLEALSLHLGLTYIDVSDGLWSQPDSLITLRSCSRLTSLNLSHTPVGGDYSDLVGSLPSLRELNLSSAFSYEPKPAALELSVWTSLTALDLSGNGIGGRQPWLQVASRLQRCTALTRLNLSANPLGQNGGALLAAVFGQNAGMREIRVATCKLGRVGASEAVRGLKGCTALAVLDLSANDIGWHGATALAEVLGGCQLVREVNVSGNAVRSNGVRQIVAALQQHPAVTATVYAGGGNLGEAWFGPGGRKPWGYWKRRVETGNVCVVTR